MGGDGVGVVYCEGRCKGLWGSSLTDGGVVAGFNTGNEHSPDNIAPLSVSPGAASFGGGGGDGGASAG